MCIRDSYKLVTVQDILSNPIDQIYILIGGFFNRPIKAKVNFWFKNPEWQGADKIPLQKQSEQNAQNEENQNQENQVSNASEETSSNTGENNIEENKQEEKEIPYNPFRIYKEKPNT